MTPQLPEVDGLQGFRAIAEGRTVGEINKLDLLHCLPILLSFGFFVLFLHLTKPVVSEWENSCDRCMLELTLS